MVLSENKRYGANPSPWTLSPAPRYKPNAVRPPHLRKPKRRYPLRVVRGLKNMATHKPVTSSTKPAIGELEQVTDGRRTSGRFDIVEGPKWVQVDMGSPCTE